MYSRNDKISLRQVEVLLILDMFSTASLTMPRYAAQFVQQDGWIIIVIGTAIAVVYGYLITTLGKRFPNKTVIEYSELLLSKPVGKLVGLLFIIKFIISVALELRIFGELVKQTLLPKTPIEIIMISMLVLASYLSRKGYEYRGRLGELLIIIVLVPIIVIFIFAFPSVKISNLAPPVTGKPLDYLEGSYLISMSYSALQVILITIPFLNKPKKAGPSITRSIIFVGVLNTIICLITIGTFGHKETIKQIWPVMTMMQVIEVPAAIIERQDALMMSFWIFTVFALINAFVYFIGVAAHKTFQTKDYYYWILPALPIIYIVALLPDNVVETQEWALFVAKYIDIVFLLIIPLVLLFVARLRKMGEVNDQV